MLKTDGVTSLNIALAFGGSDRLFPAGFVSGKASFVNLKNTFNPKDAGTVPASFALKVFFKFTKLAFSDTNPAGKSRILDSVLFAW